MSDTYSAPQAFQSPAGPNGHTSFASSPYENWLSRIQTPFTDNRPLSRQPVSGAGHLVSPRSTFQGIPSTSAQSQDALPYQPGLPGRTVQRDFSRYGTHQSEEKYRSDESRHLLAAKLPRYSDQGQTTPYPHRTSSIVTNPCQQNGECAPYPTEIDKEGLPNVPFGAAYNQPTSLPGGCSRHTAAGYSEAGSDPDYGGFPPNSRYLASCPSTLSPGGPTYDQPSGARYPQRLPSYTPSGTLVAPHPLVASGDNADYSVAYPSPSRISDRIQTPGFPPPSYVFSSRMEEIEAWRKCAVQHRHWGEDIKDQYRLQKAQSTAEAASSHNALRQAQREQALLLRRTDRAENALAACRADKADLKDQLGATRDAWYFTRRELKSAVTEIERRRISQGLYLDDGDGAWSRE